MRYYRMNKGAGVKVIKSCESIVTTYSEFNEPVYDSTRCPPLHSPLKLRQKFGAYSDVANPSRFPLGIYPRNLKDGTAPSTIQ